MANKAQVQPCRKELHLYDKARYRECPECRKARRSTPENVAKSTQQARDWRAKNMDKVRKYRNTYKTYRRQVKAQRTPSWADLKAIVEFYANCPAGYEVDHIVPLNGKNVSGLHVINNLQYLTVAENRKKGNKYE